MNVTLEKVCKNNIDRAMKMYHEIFPTDKLDNDIQNYVGGGYHVILTCNNTGL